MITILFSRKIDNGSFSGVFKDTIPNFAFEPCLPPKGEYKLLAVFGNEEFQG